MPTTRIKHNEKGVYWRASIRHHLPCKAATGVAFFISFVVLLVAKPSPAITLSAFLSG